jgi:hypothetical protein
LIPHGTQACYISYQTWNFQTVYQTYWVLFSDRIFRVSVEGEMSTPRETQAGVQQSFVLSPTLFNLYINDAPQTHVVHLALFAEETCPYVTDRKEGFIVRKLQRGLSSREIWCERWNIKINEDKTQWVYFSCSRRLPESYLILNGINIPFFNSAKYLGVILDKKITSRLHRNDRSQGLQNIH